MPDLVRDGGIDFKANAEGALGAVPHILSPFGGIEYKINSFTWKRHAASQDNRDYLLCTPDSAAFADLTVYTEARLCKGARELRIVKTDTETDAGVRYLPYQENKLSYCSLDAAVQWIFTGPIEGCSVYVVESGSDVYLFHVDSNQVPDPRENAVEKDMKLRNAINTLLPGAVIRHRLCVQDYRADRPYRGFVYGRRVGGAWEFRYHSFILDGNEPVHLHPARPLPDDRGMLA
jgi:hypothetical protein